MTIRNAAKAIIVHQGKILLIKYRGRAGQICYTIPGGGQDYLETMEEAIVRECMEETGYQVAVSDFLALYEELIVDTAYQQMHPDYVHKIFHIFSCTLQSEIQQNPAQMDAGQTGCEWVDTHIVRSLPVYPLVVRENINALLSGKAPMFLGTHKMNLPE